MTERDGQKWTLADFRRHVPRIIAERDRAEARVAELERERDEWKSGYVDAIRDVDGERLAYLETEYAIERRQREDAWAEVQELETRIIILDRRIAELEQTITQVRELCDGQRSPRPGWLHPLFVRDVLAALDGGSDD